MERLLLALVLVASPLAAQAPPVPSSPTAAQPSADRLAAAEALVAASRFDEQTKEGSDADADVYLANPGLASMVGKIRHKDGSALTTQELAQARDIAREEFRSFLPDAIAFVRRAMIDHLATVYSAEQLQKFASQPDAEKQLKQIFHKNGAFDGLMQGSDLKADLSRRLARVDKRVQALASSN